MEQKKVQEIIIETNFNQKLNCDFFIHIGPAPVMKNTDASLYQAVLNTEKLIVTKDASFEPVPCILYDWNIYFTLENIPLIMVLMSHGMSVDEFRKLMLKRFASIKPESNLAIYYFKKIKP